MLYFNSGTRLSEVLDGTSNTLMVGEVRGYTPASLDNIATVSDGRGLKFAIGTHTGDNMQPINGITRWERMSSFHPGGCLAVLGDASVRFLPESIDRNVFLWSGSMGDSEVLKLP